MDGVRTILSVPYYVVFNRYTDELHYFHLLNGQYQEITPLNSACGCRKPAWV